MSNKNANAKNWKPATLAIHGTERLSKAHHAVSTPIMHTSNYYFDTADEVEDFMRAKGQGKVIREHEYARYGNPTQIETERKLAAVEGAERAVLYSSGMAAVLLVVISVLDPFFKIILMGNGIDGNYPLIISISLMAVLTNYTAIIRIVVIFREIRDKFRVNG